MVGAPSKTACEGGRMSQGCPAWGPHPETGAWRQQGWGWNGVHPGGAASEAPHPSVPLSTSLSVHRGGNEGREGYLIHTAERPGASVLQSVKCRA